MFTDYKMMSKAVFLALFGVLSLQTFAPAEAVESAELGDELKNLVDFVDSVLQFAWNITLEREYTISNATDLMPVWDKLSQQIKDKKASPEVVKKLAERLVALADEVAQMEADELKIMPAGHKIIKEADALAAKLEPKS